MRLDCPNGHTAVIREDPKSTGKVAMCDTCGWSAQYARAQGGTGQEWEQNELRAAMEDEAQRRQLPSPSSSSSERRHHRGG